MAKKKKKEVETGRILGRLNDDGSITPFIQKQQEEDIAPVRNDNKWFKSGIDTSGYDIQNPLDAINRFNASVLMTGVDIIGQVGLGVTKPIEGVGDFAQNRVADVLDFFGGDKTAEKIRKSAAKEWGVNRELEQSLARDNDRGIDDMSFLGNKGKSIPQGVGSVLLAMGSGGLGGAIGGTNAAASVASLGIMGVGSAGNAEQEALEQGATRGEARLYGILSGASETLSEMMFGGLSKGSQVLGIGTGLFDSADDAIINSLTKKINNRLVKTFTQAGLKATSEGIEEVVSGLGSAWAKKLTYMKEEDIKKLIEDENLLDSFLSGTFSAALSQAPGVAKHITTVDENGKLRLKSNNEIKDYITDLSTNEQKIADKVAESRFTEEMTNKEKSKIRKEVMDQLRNLELTSDEINKSLGDEVIQGEPADTLLHQIIQNENTKFSFDEAELQVDNKRVNKNATNVEAKIQQLANDFTNELNDIRNTTSAHKLFNEMKNVIQATGEQVRLTSYNELEKQGAVKLLTDEKGNPIRNKNGRLQYTDEKGNLIGINGFRSKDGIVLNSDSTRLFEATMGHEIGESIKANSQSDYKVLREIATELGKLDGTLTDETMKAIERTYGTLGERTDSYLDEYVNDKLGELFTKDSELINRIGQKPTILRKIIDEVKYLVKRFTTKSAEGKKLLELQHNLENKLQESIRELNVNNKTQEGTQYSLSTQQQLNDITNQRDSLRQELLKLRKERGEITKTIPDYSMFKQYDELTDINKKIDDNLAKSKELYAKQEELKNKLEEEKEIKKKQEIEEINKKSTPFKEKQFKVLQKSNPMLDDYHTGIRQPGEIMTWEEAINDADESGEGYSWGDYTKEDALRDLDRKRVTIYSSYPIKNGTFVTPSRAQAEMYAGGEGSFVYSKTVNPDFVAWINVDEGQYANVGRNIENNTKYSLTDNQNNENEKITLADGRTYNNYYEYAKDITKNKDELAKELLFKHYSQNFDVPTNSNETKFYHGTDATFDYDGLKVMDFDEQTMDRNYGDYFYITTDKDFSHTYGSQIAEFIIPNDKILSLEDYRQNYSDKTDDELFNDYWALEMPDNEYIVKDIKPIIDYSKQRANEYINQQESKTKYSLSEDNNGRTLSQGQQDFVKGNAKELYDKDGKIKTYYHTTTNEVEPFDVFNPVGTPGYKYDDIVVNFYTDNPIMSGSYADSDYVKYSPEATEKARYQYEGYISMKNPYVIESDNRTYGKANIKANESASKTLNLLNGLSDETINELASIKQEAIDKARNQERLVKELEYLRNGFDNEQKVAIKIGEILDATEKYNLNAEAQERNNRLINSILEREGYTNEWDLDNLKYEYYTNDLGVDLSNYGIDKDKVTLKDFLELENEVQAENKYAYEFFDDMLKDHTNNKQIQEILDTTFDVKKETRVLNEETGTKQYGKVSDLVYDALDMDGNLNRKYLTKEGLQEHYVVDGFINQNTNDVIREVLEMNKNGASYDGVIFKNLYDYGGSTFNLDSNAGDVVVTFNSNQFKDFRNENPTSGDNINYSLSQDNIAPIANGIRSEQIKPQDIQEAIAPLQEQVQQLNDTITRLEDRIAPVEETAEKSKYPMIDKINDFLWKLQGKKDKYYGLLKPDFINEIANEEQQQRIDAVNNLIDNLSKKIADNNNELNINDVKDQLTTEINNYIDEYRPLTEQEGEQLAEEYANRDISNELAPIRNNLTEEENRRMDMLELLERNNMMNDERRYEKEQLENKINPVYPTEEATPGQALSDIRDIDEVGKRDVKAYQYEHPEVKPFFQEEARGMLSDLRNSQKGERIITEGQQRGQGTYYDVIANKRFTSPEIAELLDSKWGYTYSDIEKGLNAIIEDHGAENIAIAKRIEFTLDDNLRNGYTDWQTGTEIPPNQEYLNMLAEQEWQNYFDDINSQYPLEQNIPQTLDEETDFSDVKIDKDLQDMTVDDLNLEPFLQGLVKSSENQAERQQLREELNQKREVKIPKQSDGRKAWNKFKSLFVNEFAVIDDYAKQTGNKNIKFKADAYNNYQAIAQSNIETAQTDINGKAIGRSGSSIFEEAKKLGLENTFDEYLKQWANVDRAKQGKGVANYSAKESYKIVKEMETKYPALKRLGKDMWQYYRNARHNLRDAGVINQDVSDMLGRMYPHYTPYISENIENYFTDEGKLKPKATIKRAKGGAAIGSLLSAEEAMQRYTKSEFNTILGNDLYREIVNTSNDIVQLGGDDRGMQFVNADNLYADKNGYYLTAYEDGNPITTKISEDMYETLTRETKNRVNDLANTFSIVTKPLAWLSNVRRNILTSWSPTFIAKNLIKDAQEAIINSKYTKDMVANYSNPKTWIELIKGEGESDIFKNNYGSGLTMGQFDIDLDNYNPNAKNFNFLKGIKNANELIELAPRYAEFKASRQNGCSIQEAMYNAREVTTNFSRGGIITKAFNKYGMTFLNSSVQGFDKFIRNFSGENGAKGIVNSLAKAAIFGIAPAVFNELAFGSGDDKDEEYEALPDYIKDNYYIIKIGDGNFIRIPKGRVLSVFGSAARRTIEAMEGEENAFEGYWNNVQQQIGINNPEENNIFAPLIQAMGGRKLDSGQTAGEAWYGGDIIPSRLQKERPEDQYDASIDKLSIWLGQKTGISPYKINYVLDQYTGGIGDIGLPMITEEANSDGSIMAPIKDQFTADTITDNKYVSEFYDTYNKIYTGSKKTDEDILKKNYMSNISYQMSDLYKERREIQADTTLSKKEKYEKAQAIKAEINRLAKEGLDNYENISITGDYAEINGQEYQKTDDGWKKLSSNTSDEVNSLGLTNREKNNYIKTQQSISSIKQKYKGEDDYVGKKQDIIGEIINTNLDDEAKMNLYQDTYKDKFSNYATDLGFDADTYLEYKAQDFSADKDSNGKSISGSKKQKVFDYINSMDVPYEQKLILAKSEYNSFNDNNYEIIEYIENSGMDYDERIELYKALGFKVDGDSISW